MSRSRHSSSQGWAFVGRGAQMQTFEGLLRGIDLGERAVVVVSGEPGIGKTALIGELVTASRALGYETFSSRASEFERDVPFAVFVDALGGAVEAMRPGQRELMDSDELALLATIFPALAVEGVSVARVPHPDDRHLMLRALQALLGALASGRAQVLALDDLHWADPSSVDLICRLLHRGLPDRSLLVLSLRPAPSAPRLSAAFWEAERHGEAVRIELGPLSASEAWELLGDGVGRALSARLYRESGGNPFYLGELASAAGRGEFRPLEAGEFEPGVPKAVSAAITSELGRISPSARLLLQAAAVQGDPFECDLAAQTAELAERDASRALDELCDSGLVRPTESPRRLSFRHPIVHRAVYEAAGVGRRLQAHRRIASLLREKGAPVTSIAPHVARSAQLGDEQAASLLTAAGQELISRAPASAARWLGEALRVTPEADENAELRRGLSLQYAMALGLAGYLRESRDELRRFVTLAPREPSAPRVVAAVHASTVDMLLGDQAGARAVLSNELAFLSDQNSFEASQLKSGLGFVAYVDANPDQARRWQLSALGADCRGMVRVGACGNLALSEFDLGNLAEAQRAAEDGGRLLDVLTDEDVAAYYPGINMWLAQAELSIGWLADAARHAERGVLVARANGERIMTVGLLSVQAQALAFMGRIAELTTVAEAATEASLLSDSEMFLAWAMAVRCWENILTGDLSAALRFGARGAEASSSAKSPLSDVARLAFAIALLDSGDLRRCREQLTDRAEQPSLPPVAVLAGLTYESLVRAELGLRNLSRAAELAQDAWQSAQRQGTYLQLLFAHRSRALVSLARGDAESAVTEALTSCQAGERADAEVEAARSQLIAGRALAVAGDRAASITSLKEAHERLRARGAMGYADEAAMELRKLGRAVAPSQRFRRAQPQDLGLTPREHEVLKLISTGKTNRGIADDLVLSVRTVDRHVARIFEKLDVHSRAAATRALEQARSTTRPSLAYFPRKKSPW